jgi:hypothetical protein
MTKRTIPTVTRPVDAAQAKFNQAVKENLEVLMGQRAGRIAELDASATTAQIISKINEIIQRLQ